MIAKILIHTIKVLRFQQTGVNALLEPTTQSTLPFGENSAGMPNEIPCRVETYEALTQYRDSNVRPVSQTLIYIPAEYVLQEQDLVYWGAKHSPNVEKGDYLGRVSGINPALKFDQVTVDHWEVKIENP